MYENTAFRDMLSFVML